MTRFLASIRSQRDRAGRIALLAFLAGVLFHLDQHGHIGSLPIPLFTGLLYAVFATPAAVVTAVFLPGMVPLTDRVQWSRLALATSTAAFPSTLHPFVDQPLISATLTILGAVGWRVVRDWMVVAPAAELA